MDSSQTLIKAVLPVFAVFAAPTVYGTRRMACFVAEGKSARAERRLARHVTR
jgi:hypothetical protein